MTKRIQKLLLAVAALTALALGGAVFAQAQSSPTAGPERTSAPDRDNIQSGDQTTPDAANARVGHRRQHGSRVAATKTADRAGGDSAQSGDQSTPDTGSSAEAPGTENPDTGTQSESTPANDGPGGHADPAGSANADHQFQGNE